MRSSVLCSLDSKRTSFLAPLKDPFDLPFPFDEIREEGNFPFYKELHSGDEVSKEIFASQFIVDEHGRLMDPPAPLDALNKSLVKEMDVLLLCLHSFLNTHLS